MLPDLGRPYLRTGQVAELAGVNVQTLRYYERRGLIAEPRRSPGGHRAYPPETVTLLGVIKTAQRLGFTLQEVAELIETATHRHRRPGSGLAARAAAKLAEVEAKIADLNVISGTLRRTLDAGCDDLVACAGEPGCPLPFADLVGDVSAVDDAPHSGAARGAVPARRRGLGVAGCGGRGCGC